MTVVIRVNIEQAKIKKMVSDPKGPVARGVLRISKRVERRAKKLAPVDKGLLRASITTQLTYRGGIPIGRVGTKVKYAIWVHEGTGIYGPRGMLIRPKKAQFLVFRPKGSAQIIRAKSVRGMRPRPFLRDALSAVLG